MPMSRPSLAFAGGAAVVIVAGIISHQVLLTPPSSTFDRAGPASVSPGASVEVQDLPAPPAPAAHVEARRESEMQQRRLDEDRRNLAMDAEWRTATTDSLGTEQYLAQYPREARTKSMRDEAQRLAFDSPLPVAAEQGRDRFTEFDANPVRVVAEEPVSTFSIDVDTASYGFMRASLNDGHLPDEDSVRTEELINYFPYDYAPPATRDEPFATHVSVMPAPWNESARLLHIGIKGYELDRTTAPRANLVFLIDTSGSMDQPNKLPLLINSFKLLLSALAPEDRVAIVAYAGSAGVVLEPTPVSDRATILSGLERLSAGGSTAGAEGIRAAYLLAEQHRIEGGVNRVILATDGDFNVGISDPGELEEYIARKRTSGVSLSVLGFGRGQLQRRADAEPRPERQRQRRLHRHAVGGPQGAARGSVVDPRHHRRRREDPGRVQSRGGQRIPADRIRDPDARARGLPQRQGRCRRHRRRSHGDRHLRADTGGIGGASESPRVATAPIPRHRMPGSMASSPS